MAPRQDSFWTEKNSSSSSQGNECCLYCDGEAYFHAFIHACAQARHSIYILGWDLHTQTQLQPRHEDSTQDWTLLAFLQRILHMTPELHIHLLTWRPAPLYIMERERLQNFKFTGWTHPRLHFRADSRHPLGGSHHQKVVVVDDQLAFVGGIDLTIRRWDSCRHGALDPLRKDPEGHYYQPYHDTQLGISGPAALQLAWLFRERWRQLTHEKLRPVDAELVPITLDAHDAIARFRNAPVSISVTDPGFRKAQATLEIAELYKDLLWSAEKYVFIETQYLTSRHLVEVLCDVLSRPMPPDIFIILPERLGPWLEKKTMTHLQALALTEIMNHDHKGKLRILYPFDRELLPIYKYVTVHSKLMVVDDCFLTLGSANLNNRSMGLDTECNVTIDARDQPHLQAAIRQALAFIIAHYANHRRDYALRKIEHAASLTPLIESLRMISPYKHLADFTIRLAPEDFIPWVDAQWLDMDQPTSMELALDRWGRTLEAVQRPLKIPSRVLTFVLTGLAAVSIAASHVWMVQPLQESPWHGVTIQFSGLLLIPLLYLLAYLVFAPINLLILVAAGFFPSLEALPYIVLAVIIFVSLAYAAGRTLGRIFFPALHKALEKDDLAALCLLQTMPIAPHMLVNAAAGAAGVPFLRFLLLTLIGMIPGCVMLALFQRTVIQLFVDPSWSSAWPLLILLVFISFIFRWSSQRFANYGSL